MPIWKKFSIHSMALTFVNKLNIHTQKEGPDYQKMVLGAEIFLHNVPKLVLMAVVSVILGILPQAFVAWLSFACIRRYAGGLHAANAPVCTLVSLLMFVAVPYLLYGMYVSNLAVVLIFALYCLALYRYAPADTAACPILGKKKRALLKKKAMAAGFILPVLALLILDTGYIILVVVGAGYGILSILPVTYKILGRSMNNYEKYE